jgi:hypothetical protein
LNPYYPSQLLSRHHPEGNAPSVKSRNFDSSARSASHVKGKGAFMSEESAPKFYPVEEAVKAQEALRTAAGLGPEMFPLQAFVGMISDEIDLLRKCGKSDEQIAALVCRNSSIQITAEEITQNYASPEDRHQTASDPG